MYHRLDRWLFALEMACMGIGTAAAVAVATVQVILRYVAGTGLFWAEEFTVYTIIWVAFLSAGAAVRTGDHLTVEILQVVVGSRYTAHLTRAVAVVGVMASSAMLVYGFEFVMSAYDFGQVSAALQIPMWIVYLVVPLSGVLLIIRFAQRIIDPVSSAEVHAAELAC